MKLFNLIPALAGEREKETIQLIKEHADMTYRVVCEFKNAFNALEKKDYKTLKEKVDRVSSLESRADDLRREIEEKMYSGAFLPGSRRIILNFAERVDDVADAAQDAARILIFLEDREISKDMFDLLELELKDGLDTIDIVRESISDLRNVDEIRLAIGRVREKEHESDEIANKIYSILYRNVKHDPITVLLLSKLITYIGNISDKAEDATDALSLIILLHRA
ncbi:MAG: TIGR00153 family protein [Candidatus Altiarchaeales archaeon ex4484_43]|nr:MAG: TIGR00153 family protein [Candidatus Altiarchaeales archaeon ex4484_43]